MRMKALVVGGADLNATNKLNETALQLAAERNDFETVRTLVEHGAEPNVTRSDGWSPLYTAGNQEFI